MQREMKYFENSASASQPGIPFPSFGGGPKYQDFSAPWTQPSKTAAEEREDFLSWPVASDYGDTTADDRSLTAATSSGDEESDHQAAPWGAASRKADTRSWKEPRAAPQPEVRRELPTEGLIDIDPEEGKKRGGELFSMLFDAPAEPPLPTMSADAPAFNPPKPMAQPPQQPQTRQPAMRQPPSQTQWAASWEGCGTGGWSAGASEATPPATDSPRHDTAVQQAAQDAFGSLLKEVVVAKDGYMVLLDESLRQYKEMPVLQILSQALWPLLGREVVALEPAEPQRPGQHRLALSTKTGGNQSCWEFATTGACPRGNQCRWGHETQSTIKRTYIDVVY